MTNYEYIKTLSQDAMIQFIVNDMFIVFDNVENECALCWGDNERNSTELEMWKNWLNEQHKESSS